MTTPRPGLRERKKQATSKALRDAALRLALERGPDNVRVDDIAEAAGVSPRTYNNYFSSREQAIVAAVTAEREARVAATVAARPGGVRLSDAVVEAIVEQYTDPGSHDPRALALITTSSALRDAFLDAAAGIEDPLTAAIAGRIGDTGLRTAPVLSASVAAAVRIALRRWLRLPADPAPPAGSSCRPVRCPTCSGPRSHPSRQHSTPQKDNGRQPDGVQPARRHRAEDRRLALGCMSYGDPATEAAHRWALADDDAQPFFRQAIELGITFWDTANVYQAGTSEEVNGADRRLPGPARHQLRRPVPDPPLRPRHPRRRDHGGPARTSSRRARPATSARRRSTPGSSPSCSTPPTRAGGPGSCPCRTSTTCCAARTSRS